VRVVCAAKSMITEHEYLALDGVAQAELVRRGELDASELLEAAIARTEKLNPRLNAIVIHMHEIARQRARTKLTGPMAGVPFLLKDLFQDYAGVLATSGSRALRKAGATPARHSEIVARDLAAGLVIFGRSNTCEFGAKGITEPDAWGATRNPWDLAHSPGGSSGGAAAAVAAGIVAIAGASDGGGSIRIPAASCGLFGLKPGRGRTPSGPDIGEAVHGAAMNHVITRSVRDSATMLDATCGPERGAPYYLAPPARSYAEEVVRGPKRLRISFSTRSPLGTPVDPAAIAAVEKTAQLLSELGHHVEPAEPEIDGIALARDFLRVWFAQLAVQIESVRRRWGASAHDFELDSLAMAAVGRARSAVDYAASYIRWGEYGVRLGEFLARYDLYMTPTLAAPPPKVGELTPPAWAAVMQRAFLPFGLTRLIALAEGTVERIAIENLRSVPFAQLANVTGVPAMTVPAGNFANGLPLAVHFLADHGGEGLLLATAGELERAAPWQGRLEELWARSPGEV
jgi:amidase